MDIKEIDVETTHEPLVSPVPNREVLPAAPEPTPAPVKEPEKVPAGV